MQGKGLNKKFGFHIMRPFYFRSRLPWKRVIECVSNAYPRLKKYAKGRKAQQWVFNNKNKTVEGWYWKNRAIEITSNGKSQTLRMNTPNARWW
jgi:hypothetical protein